VLTKSIGAKLEILTRSSFAGVVGRAGVPVTVGGCCTDNDQGEIAAVDPIQESAQPMLTNQGTIAYCTTWALEITI
jgi:hypothetical protein